MADQKPPEGGAGAPGDESPRLPPRSGDWQSGLKKPESVSPARPHTAPDTVSSFLAKGQHGPDSVDWDPVDTTPPKTSESSGNVAGQRNHHPHDAAEWTALAGAPLDSKVSHLEFAAPETPMTNPRPLNSAENLPPEEPPRRVPVSYYNSPTRFTDWLIALLLAVLACGSVAFTYHGFGHSWDEALYLKPAESAAAWMQGVINSGDDTMLRREAVDRHWGTALTGYDPLHPEVAPVPKLLPGAGITYLQKPLRVDEMTAMRLPNAILFGLTVALLFLLGTREYGRIGGFAAALFYVLMPRVFGHAHIAASETPLAFFTVLTVWCFLIANRFWPFALFTGIALGCAIATKIPALALPVPLMLWGQIYRRRDYASNVFAMAFVAPLVALALWPWLWYDSFARFVNYLGFYLEHQQTAVFYMGRKWGYHSPTAPLIYPLHLTALILPIWLLFFLALGFLRGIFSTISRPVTILFLLMIVFWLGLAMLPNAPRYDGERLWFGAFAFIALIAGGGFSWLLGGVRRWRERREVATSSRETGYVAAIALLVLGIYGAGDIYFTHPNELNYYNWIVGRARGAYDQGYETSYWGEGVNEEVTAYLNQVLKPGDKVKTLALNEEAFENLRRWGKLPAKVDFSPDEPPYDYAILQIRQGFMGPVERQLDQSKKPLKVFEAGGVPRIKIFDKQALANVFPAQEEDENEESTTTVEATEVNPGDISSTATVTSGTAINNAQTTSGAAITPVTDGVTTAAAVRARDFSTTGSEAVDPASKSDATTAPAVLDLHTTASAEQVPVATPTESEGTTEPETAQEPSGTPALSVQLTSETDSGEPQPDVATSHTLQMPARLEAETSAPAIYEGDPPTTAPDSL